MGNHGTGCHDHIVSDGDAGKDRYIAADPDIVADSHRFGDA